MTATLACVTASAARRSIQKPNNKTDACRVCQPVSTISHWKVRKVVTYLPNLENKLLGIPRKSYQEFLELMVTRYLEAFVVVMLPLEVEDLFDTLDFPVTREIKLSPGSVIKFHEGV